uniref:G patch domain-containing protein 4 n=1 Tax=Maylandia zebra TaxID=106582 RepID=A0A3P9CMM2_9CICH
MAEVVQEKSRGLKFAEQQLLRHGWEHGKGLGRAENGISEAIKVKVKCDKGGVGHKEGEQFTFHWWDHVFNKASSSLQVESDQVAGLTVGHYDTFVHDMDAYCVFKCSLFYSHKQTNGWLFFQSATLLSGQEQPEPKASSSDDCSSSDEEDEQRMDLSSTTKLSDTDLMKVCGGRTAHKGARHGLTMSAKLARLEQQEAEFMAKYGKKNQPASAPPLASRLETPEEMMTSRKKMKMNEKSSDGVCETPTTDVQPKKKKKEKKSADPEERTDEDLIHVENCEADDSHKKKKKQKKKNKVEENRVEETHSPAAESEEVTAEMHADEGKKKKKSSKPPKENDSDCKEPSQSNHTGLEDSDVTESVKKRKKCKKDKTCTHEEAPPLKRKKKKSKD